MWHVWYGYNVIINYLIKYIIVCCLQTILWICLHMFCNIKGINTNHIDVDIYIVRNTRIITIWIYPCALSINCPHSTHISIGHALLENAHLKIVLDNKNLQTRLLIAWWICYQPIRSQNEIPWELAWLSWNYLLCTSISRSCDDYSSYLTWGVPGRLGLVNESTYMTETSNNDCY